MAGSKVNDFSIGDSNIQSVMLTLDKAYKGLHQVSLTNYDNTSESQIAAGSVVECNGAQYKFDSNESITGSPSDGTVYIRLVPSGDTITAEYTATAPTWSDSKQGWYGTSTDANKRYLEFAMTLDSTSWDIKESLTGIEKQIRREHLLYFADGTQTISASTTTQIIFHNKKYDFANFGTYNSSTGLFTAKFPGVYSISAYVGQTGGSPPFTYGFNYKTVSDLVVGEDARNTTLYLNAGGTIYVRFSNSGSTSTINDKSYILVKKID